MAVGIKVGADITDLGNYIVTMTGKDMFDVLDAALEHAGTTGRGAALTSVGPVGL
jgi:hypothetical protein